MKARLNLDSGFQASLVSTPRMDAPLDRPVARPVVLPAKPGLGTVLLWLASGVLLWIVFILVFEATLALGASCEITGCPELRQRAGFNGLVAMSLVWPVFGPLLLVVRPRAPEAADEHRIREVVNLIVNAALIGVYLLVVDGGRAPAGHVLPLAFLYGGTLLAAARRWPLPHPFDPALQRTYLWDALFRASFFVLFAIRALH